MGRRDNTRRGRGQLERGSATKAASSTKGSEKPILVNLWEGSAVKNNLDDVVKEAALDAANDYKELFESTDFKLGSSAAACGFALFACAYGFLTPHPASSTVVGVCAGMYFAIVSVLSVHATFLDRMLLVEAIGPDKTKLELATGMARYDDKYQVHVTCKDAKGTAHTEHIEKSVASFFYDDGELARDIVTNTVQTLVKSALAKCDSKKSQ